MIWDNSDNDYGWDDGGDDFIAVDNGGNDDRMTFVIVMKVAMNIRGSLTYDGGNDLQ